MKKTFSLIFMALYLGAMLISAKAEPFNKAACRDTSV